MTKSFFYFLFIILISVILVSCPFSNQEPLPFSREIIIQANVQADYDYFGYGVSISGDYAIVGATGVDSGGVDRGQAYIYY